LQNFLCRLKISAHHWKIGLVLILLTTIVHPNAAWADDEPLPGATPDTAIPVELDTTQEFAIHTANEPVWFKLNLTSREIFNSTHVIVETTGELAPSLRVFPTENDLLSPDGELELDTPFTNQYGAEDGLNAKVEVPIAWDEPLYIQVTSWRMGTFGLHAYTTAKEPQYGQCLVEIAVPEEPEGVQLIKDIRSLRDNLLKKSEQGNEFIQLYYELSPRLVLEMATDKRFRESVYHDLLDLQPLIREIDSVGKGKTSSYRIHQNELQTARHLKESILSRLPAHLQTRVNETWNELSSSLVAGAQIHDLLSAPGLSVKKADYNTNEVIVKVKKLSRKTQALSKVKETLRSQLDGHVKEVKTLASSDRATTIDDTYLVKLSGNIDPLAAAEKMQESPMVEFAEPNYKVYAFSNDVSYSYQWSLENKDGHQGKAGADINFIGMKKLLDSKNLEKTVIAVVDSGINYRYADFHDTVLLDEGINFVDRNLDPMDDNGHGSHVSGIIAAIGDNGYGVTGINQYSSILPIKVLDESGEGNSIDVALGIRYAVNHGAKVINVSLGSSTYSKVVDDALQYAIANNVTPVVAAGNDSSAFLSFPASVPDVLSVGATDNKDKLASFSNYGRGLDVVAPGEDIPSYTTGGQVVYLSGTSMAAPHVSAVAGLLYSLKPDITPGEVKKIIRESSNDLGDPGYDEKYGAGRLDAAKAIQTLLQGDQLQVVKTDPAKNQKNVPTDAPITITFSSDLKNTSKVNLIRLTDKNKEKVKFTASISKNTLILKPSEPLRGKSKYTVTIPVNAIKGTKGQPLATPFVFSFTTGASAPNSLAVVETVPQDQSVDVPINEAILVKFNKPLQVAAGITLLDSDGKEVEVESEVRDENRMTVVISPANDLDYEKNYTLTIPAHAVQDRDGIGLQQAYTFQFQTMSQPAP